MSKYRYLAHLLGPKAENEQLVVELLTRIFLDYSHWRQNYFPDDPAIITPAVQRSLEAETDNIRFELNKLLAGLRRSFPFYSPRYIGHQQSETTMASILGTFAGTLYNSNNVTTESGAVTVDWEIEACNAIMSMLGYRRPPEVPKTAKDIELYRRKLEHEFGWCHLTSGGTVATIEALWAARIVKYFPLSVADACRKNEVEVSVKLPDGTPRDITTLGPWELLNLKPNESIYLLGRFVAAIYRQKNVDVEMASELAWQWIDESPYSPRRGVGKTFADYPPVILTSGAAHYSVAKAADVLGLGREAVQIVNMDSKYRMDVNHLAAKIAQAQIGGKAVVAVVAMVGTTEEGAVDPIDGIASLCTKLERTENKSFWLHVDAAWGGFIRSLFVDDEKMDAVGSARQLLSNRLHELCILGKVLPKVVRSDPPEIALQRLMASIESKLELPVFKPRAPDDEPNLAVESESGIEGEPWFQWAANKLKLMMANRQYAQVLPELKFLLTGQLDRAGKTANEVSIHRAVELAGLNRSDFEYSRLDHVNVVKDFVSHEVELSIDSDKYKKKLILNWPKDDVGTAFIAMDRADSITIDPHKMGYTVYPCGAVAFRNDRVRHLLTQEAPYITSARHSALLHVPPRHADLSHDVRDVTSSFGPFTLEGSRPGASACSLLLTSRTLPFNRQHHGTLVRSSILAARALYEWLVRWNSLAAHEEPDYDFVPYTAGPPDTNIVIFGVKRKSHRTLPSYNAYNKRVYEQFSIRSELGEREHSYAQAFFLSWTEFSDPKYSYECVRPFLERASLNRTVSSYREHGLIALRATVMNPYILPLWTDGGHNLIREFLMNVHAVANERSV